MQNDPAAHCVRRDSLHEPSDASPVPSLQWHLIDVCNYKCEYCGESRYDPNRPHVGRMSDDLIERTLKVTRDLPGTWRVSFSSGEPTLDLRLVEICGRLVDQGHMIGLITNFSMSPGKQRELVEACGERLEFLHASLHLSQVAVPEFLERALNFNSIKHPGTSFEIGSVMIPEKFDRLQRLYEEFTELGLNLKFQFRRDGTGFRDYSPEIEEFMRQRAFPTTFQLRAQNFWGELCHAGELFFIVKQNGDCFRCFEMRQPWSYLGSVRNGTFRRYKRPEPCLSERCLSLHITRRRLQEPGSTTTRAWQIYYASRCGLRGCQYILPRMIPAAKRRLVRRIQQIVA